ncbi:MAG: site-2 protease family protein, partial [Clostridia bacterium]|nr:site-2 protease family protein [Clostridia bacterium]
QEDEYPEPKGERFNDQPAWKRILVLLAGATMNYLLALILIVAMFAGIGRPLYSVVVEKPEQDTAAVSAVQAARGLGLQTGDVVLKINGKNVYLITDYIDALNGEKAGTEIPVVVLSEGTEQTRTLVLAQDANFANMSDTQTLLKAMNIYGLYTVTQRQGFFPAIGHSFAYSFKIGGTVLRSLGELLTGKLGLSAMGGPVTTISITAQAATSGLASFLNIAAFIGVNLAVFNLLPVPALDGCKVIFCIIEWIRKKPVNRKVEAIINLVGIIFLFGFAILVDLLQLIW